MNRLSTLSVGVALGTTLALMSMLCALAFALWQDATLDFFGVLISAVWRVLYEAQRLATVGPYAYVRHPHYVGFVLVMAGFLIQWPTLLTLAMFPILVGMYVRLSFTEEREARNEFGETYDRYAARVPAFIPHLSRLPGTADGPRTR
jgi:protein-S-isoprenylcysteine O-methyltransferase Ste14